MQPESSHSEELPKSQETESLVRRLAGPSSGKAGLAKDQSEINRIIADVSKGSKFYENEKKKDKELTERINKVLRIRDEVVKDVDLSKVEATVDRLITELESQRDLSQAIVHVDMDAFYASVELLNNPELEGKPFGVGRGVLTTASYEARKYGVRSGMATFVAKKLCPELITVSNHFSQYMEMSNRIMAIFKRYDPTMLPAGCDEGYLNITAYCKEHSISAEDCVQEMRKIVFDETKLTVSAGIAPNKLLAKVLVPPLVFLELRSDLTPTRYALISTTVTPKNKPNGQFHLPFDRERIVAFMSNLSIRKVPGIGRVNERLLESIGIKTCGDIFAHRATVALMDKQFGLHFLLRTYLGMGSNEVRPPQREERKSIGAERTFSPMDDRQKLLQMLEHIASELEADMTSGGWTGRTVTLKYKLDTYQVFTRAKSLNHYVSSKEDLLSIGRDLFLAEGHLKLRLIGLRVTKLKDLRASSPTDGIKRFFEPINASPRKRRKVDQDNQQYVRHDHDGEEQHMDAMPGFYEHEEEVHNMESESEAQDDEAGQLQLDNEKSKEKPRPPVSAPARPSSSSVKLEDIPDRPKPKPLGRERSKSDVGYRPPQSRTDLSDRAKSQTCPICSQVLMTDNRGLNAHIDFCLSKSAIQEARNGDPSIDIPARKPTSTNLSTKPTTQGWDFLMSKKEDPSRSKGRKRKK